MSLTKARSWHVVPFTNSGKTVLAAGTANTRIFVKHIIFTVDSATDIDFRDEDDRILTCTFQFPHVGAMYALDQLNILVGIDKDFCVNSSNAVSGSLMLDYQRIAV